MNAWTWLERDGVRLAYVDYGGDGTPMLLLHGLGGHVGEWADTADGMKDRARVVAFDARGHGRSERRPEDVSREAHVADVAFVIEQLELGPVVVVGQSLGGVTALLVAAEHPELVRGLVLGDADPAQGDEAHVGAVEQALASWPDQRYDLDVMSRTLREAAKRAYWDEWDGIACPILIVRAGNGVVEPADAEEMCARAPDVRLVELAGAEHDLHLDRPEEWCQALTEFLDSLDGAAPDRDR